MLQLLNVVNVAVVIVVAFTVVFNIEVNAVVVDVAVMTVVYVAVGDVEFDFSVDVGSILLLL